MQTVYTGLVTTCLTCSRCRRQCLLGNRQAGHRPHVWLQRSALPRQKVASRPDAAAGSSQVTAALLEQVHGAVRGAGREQELRVSDARPAFGSTAAGVPPQLADAARPRIDPSHLMLLAISVER